MDREELEHISNPKLLIEAVRVKLFKSKLDLRSTVERWRRDCEVEGKHRELREKGDLCFMKKEYSKALHFYRYYCHTN